MNDWLIYWVIDWLIDWLVNEWMNKWINDWMNWIWEIRMLLVRRKIKDQSLVKYTMSARLSYSQKTYKQNLNDKSSR